MKACISEATILPSTFAEDVAAIADAGAEGMEVWLTKLETHLETHSISETRKLLEDRNLQVPAAAYQGGLLLSQGEARKAHFDHYKRRLELCQHLGVKTLLIVADFVEKVTERETLERAVVSLTQAGQWAAGYDVNLALEFRGRDAFCSSLETAISLVESCPEPNVGINLDIFHYYTGSSKWEDLAQLPPNRLMHLQFSDLSGVPRELATDADRILPGDGDFQLAPWVEYLRQIKYSGWVSLELMNPMIWRMKPQQVAEIGLTALRRILGLLDKNPPN